MNIFAKARAPKRAICQNSSAKLDTKTVEEIKNTASESKNPFAK